MRVNHHEISKNQTSLFKYFKICWLQIIDLKRNCNGNIGCSNICELDGGTCSSLLFRQPQEKIKGLCNTFVKWRNLIYGINLKGK